jgi:hypothetical protein
MMAVADALVPALWLVVQDVEELLAERGINVTISPSCSGFSGSLRCWSTRHDPVGRSQRAMVR